MKINKIYGIAFIIFLVSVVGGHGADWCIQVSTFRNLDGIRQDFEKLKSLHDARIENIEGIYSLRVGYYSTEGQAKGGLRTIRQQFPNAYVRKCAHEPDRVVESTPSSKAKKKAGAVEKRAKASRTAAPASGETSAPAKAPLPASVQKKSPVLPPPVKVSPPPETAPAPPPARASLPPKIVSAPAPQAAAPSGAVPSPATPAAVADQPQAPQTPPPVDSAEAQQLFGEGERLRIGGHYAQAIEMYKKIIQSAPTGGELPGKATYRIALCHDTIGEKKLAEAEYMQAMDKWPGLDIAPAPLLFAGGMKAYQEGKYEGALKIFTVHITAYPDDARRTEYMTACALMQMGRYNAAMYLFDRIIEMYPDSSEATESIVAFGNIGLLVPKVRATMFTNGYEWYRDPLHAYDTALTRQLKQPTWTSEHILYAKGYALMVRGRHEDAQRTLIKVIKNHLSSPRTKTYKATAGANAISLFKYYYDREDYAGVVSTYFTATGNGNPLPADAANAIMIGKSLERMGFFEDASNFLKAARIKATGNDEEQIGRAIEDLKKSAGSGKVCDEILKEYRDLQSAGQAVPPSLAVRAADCLFMAGQYEDCLPLYTWALGNSLPVSEKRWSLLRKGQASLKLGNADNARKTFDELKAIAADEFWSKLADFAYEDGKWTQRFNQGMKKK